MTLLYPKTEDIPWAYYNSKEVFEACIKQGHDWVKAYMYMHSDDAKTHHFKCPLTRKYRICKLAGE